MFPAMMSQFQPHLDMINSLEMLERNDRLLILSSSADCSVALWDIYGNQIGVFGQVTSFKLYFWLGCLSCFKLRSQFDRKNNSTLQTFTEYSVGYSLTIADLYKVLM